MADERPTSPRVVVDVPARLTVGGETIEARVRDICHDAALVEAPRSYPLETVVQLETELPRVTGPIQATGRVIRLAPGRGDSHGMAILFDELSSESTLRMDLFLSEQDV